MALGEAVAELSCPSGVVRLCGCYPWMANMADRDARRLGSKSVRAENRGGWLSLRAQGLRWRRGRWTWPKVAGWPVQSSSGKTRLLSSFVCCRGLLLSRASFAALVAVLAIALEAKPALVLERTVRPSRAAIGFCKRNRSSLSCCSSPWLLATHLSEWASVLRHLC